MFILHFLIFGLFIKNQQEFLTLNVNIATCRRGKITNDGKILFVVFDLFN